MAGLTTHVLDTAHGQPAQGMTVELLRHDEHGATELLKTMVTNNDGRTGDPLLSAQECEVGRYEIRFHVGDYFDAEHLGLVDPPFLDVVPVAFSIASPGEHYHVPLLVSPWSYSTYRGS